MLFVAGQAMSAYRWQLLAAILGVRGSFREFLAYYFVGMFTNLFVPGQVGGDAVRAIYLGRRHHRMGDALASVIANRCYGLLGLFWLAAASTYMSAGYELPPGVTTTVLLIGVFSRRRIFVNPMAREGHTSDAASYSARKWNRRPVFP